MKKVIPLLVVGFLVVSGFGVSALPHDKLKVEQFPKNETITPINGDELDQQQTYCDGVIELGDLSGYNFQYAQSFTPQKDILTRIFLYVDRIGQPYPFCLAIRKELNGENLTTVSVSYNHIPSGNLAWVEFDFEDISVIVGESYYMIMSTRFKSNTNYGVGMGSSNPYPNGNFWIAFEWVWDEGWDDDFCFKTYGRDVPLEIIPSGGLGKVRAEIRNEYGYNVENIQWSISVKGGFLNRIDIMTNGIIDVLETGKTETISIDKFILGFGPLEIIVSAEVSPIEKLTMKIEGFVFIIFITVT